METLMMYLLKMFICSGILFGYYRLALYNERFHQWNRFYLLGAMVLSVIVPFLSIPVFADDEQGDIAIIIASMPWNAPVAFVAPAQSGLSLRDGLLFGVSIISIAMLLKLFVNIASLIFTYRTNPRTSLNNKVRLVLTQLNHAPFSFFNWLFWRKDIDPASESGQRMLTHELTHISEHHSIDKIFTEVLLCLFWMNPFSWLIRRELGMIHEFLADHRAIRQQDGAAFAAMILHALKVQPAATSGLVNPLFSSTIKRRLLMITTSKEPRYSYLRRLSGLALMICSALVLTLSLQQAEAQQKEKQKERKVNAVVEKQDSLSRVRNTKKPLTTSEELITVEADTIIWNGNTVQAFGITASGKKVKIEISKRREEQNSLFLKLARRDKNDPTKLKVVVGKNQPVYIVDGEELDPKEFETIDPYTINEIRVLKDIDAIAEYGERGKNGVLIITTKSKVQEAPVTRNPVTKVPPTDFGKKKVKQNEESLKEVTEPGYETQNTTGLSNKLKTSEKPGIKERDGEIKITYEQNLPDKIFTKVEQPAHFPGGESAWSSYLEKNLRYPDVAIKAGTEGVARIQFIVDEKGAISNIKALHNPGNGIGEEAVRLIKQGPKWQPALQNGNVVAYQVELSIDFKTNKYF